MSIETPLAETVISSIQVPRYSEYDVNKMLGQNFLKSARFAITIPIIPDIIGLRINPQDLTFLCDSVEFPGQSLTTTEYRMPGKLKLKVPYVREMNEVTMTFYHNDKLPIYEMFSNWIQIASSRNTQNLYFDQMTCPRILIYQFNETSGVNSFVRDLFNTDLYRGSENKTAKYMTVELVNAIPLNFASMQSNWADDGFHKLQVSMFYENMIINQGINGLSFTDLVSSKNINQVLQSQNPVTRPEDNSNSFSGPR
jgi:hypothetical protein